MIESIHCFLQSCIGRNSIYREIQSTGTDYSSHVAIAHQNITDSFIEYNNMNNNPSNNDPYTVLGVSTHASLSEIRSAYKEKALRYHPDKQSQNDFERIQAHEKFTKINAAYQLLSDPHARYLYDIQRGRDAQKQLRERDVVVPPPSSVLRRFTTTSKSSENGRNAESNSLDGADEDNPFHFFDKIFRQEFGSDIFGPNRQDDVTAPNDNATMNKNSKNNDVSDLFPFFPWNRPDHAKNDLDRFPFSTASFNDVFRQQEAMMKRVAEDMKQQQEGKNSSSRYYSTYSSSSSSTTTKKGKNGEWITTTTKTVQRNDGKGPQSVQETVVYNTDGSVKERTITGSEDLIQQQQPAPPPPITTSSIFHHRALPEHPPSTTTNSNRTDEHSNNKSWWSSLWHNNNNTNNDTKKSRNHNDRRDSE